MKNLKIYSLNRNLVLAGGYLGYNIILQLYPLFANHWFSSEIWRTQNFIIMTIIVVFPSLVLGFLIKQKQGFLIYPMMFNSILFAANLIAGIIMYSVWVYFFPAKGDSESKGVAIILFAFWLLIEFVLFNGAYLIRGLFKPNRLVK